jgi:uncharacterized protein
MIRTSFAVLLAMAALSLPAAENRRVRVLVLTGETDLPYHDWRVSTPYLRDLLERSGRFEVRVAEHVSGMRAADLAPYDLLLLNYNGPRWDAAAETAIEEFVRSGKGMISFHGVTYGRFYGMTFNGRWKASPAGDKGWEAYPSLIGATWDPPKIGHGARHVFKVKWVDREHPVARGLEETFTANDELYHRLTLLPNAHVLASAYSDPKTGGTGNDEPIVWTASFGNGRTLHMTLGHDLTALSQPGVQAVILRGAEWAATGAVTLRPPSAPPE